MLKKFFFFLLIASPLVLSAQTMETHGFIPNKGQYGSDIEGKTLLGKFAGLSLDLWLTEEGIEIVYWLGKGDWEKEEQIGKQKIKIQGAHKITTSMLSVSDSSTEVFHYYLAHCPEGIRDIHSYGKLRIKNILNGIDWEISTDAENAFVQTFTTTNPSLASSKIIEILSKNNDTIRKDTLRMGTSYPLLLKPNFQTSQDLSPQVVASSDSFLYQDWGTLFGGGKNVYGLMKQKKDLFVDWSKTSRFDLRHSSFSLTSSCNDTIGNLYLVGKSKLSAFAYYLYGDSTFRQDSAGIKSDAFLARFDTSGTLCWIIYYGSSQHDEAHQVIVNAKNEIYVGGGIDLSWFRHTYNINQAYVPYSFQSWKNDFPLYASASTSYSDTGTCFFLKFDSEGKRLWATLFGTDPYVKDKNTGIEVKTWPNQMCLSSEGSLYVAGSHSSQSYKYNPSANFNYDFGKGKSIPTFGSPGQKVWSFEDIEDIIPPIKNIVFGKIQYTFLLKIDSLDRIIWSSYYPACPPILSLHSDPSGNLYILGNTTYSNYPPLQVKKEAYFAQRENLDSITASSVNSTCAYIAALNIVGQQTWCTHLCGGNTEKEPYRDIRKNAGGIYAGDMCISPQRHLLVTGNNSSVFFPIVKKDEALFMGLDFLDTTTSGNSFIMEFDTKGALIWSTLYVHDKASLGSSIVHTKEGGFLLLEQEWERRDFVPIPDQQETYFSCFNKKFQVIKQQQTPAFTLPFSDWLEEVPILNDRMRFVFQSLLNFVSPSLKLSLSPTGKLFVTGNAAEFDSLALRKPFSTSYLQTQPLWDTLPLTGFILRYDLCDTTLYAPISLGFTDSLYCMDEKINVFLQLSSADYSQHQIVWNAGTPDEVVGDIFRITQTGTYFVQARNIYSGCPSVYSDTIRVDYMQKPRHSLPTDTLSFCVGEGSHVLNAFHWGGSYLWSDGSTDSVYQIRYHGDSIETVWCTVSTRCYEDVTDSAVLRFLPPYAYLGKDSVLCGEDTLQINASFYNQNIPADLEYLWTFNGDTVQRGILRDDAPEDISQNPAIYTLRPYDSGRLCLQVLWLESECKIAKDTMQVSYYPYPDIDFTLAKDTTICYYDSAHIDLQIPDSNDTEQVYKWYRGKNEQGIYVGEGPSQRFSEEGYYTVIGHNHCSRLMKTIQIVHYPKAWITPQLPEDTLFCKGQSITLDARTSNPTTQYLWKDLEEAPQPIPKITQSLSTENGVRTFTKAGDYSLLLQDTAGCQNTLDINIQEDDCVPKIEMPNVFTPNGDGINDYFKIKTAEKIYHFEIFIFNAWGNKVYTYKGETENFEWNGELRGRAVPDGAYFYIVTYKDFLGKAHQQTGSITILR
ncbi:MAG: gliding motility-associated C-terminal domain-containing protein [Bacteroidales bacterium]